MLILLSLRQTGYSMPAGQSGHCQCISLVNTGFFQNNTTNGGDGKIRTYSPEGTDLQSAAPLQLRRISKVSQ